MNVESNFAFIKTESNPIETVALGIHRQILGYGASLMMCRIQFELGAVGAVHQHPHCQTSYVESGQFKVFINGQETVLKTGDCFYVGPNLDHGLVCLEPGVIIDSFSPCRTDFLAPGEQA